MLFDLPSDDRLYQALIHRSTDYDGLAFVLVTSTRIFCRLSCTARKPKRENCRFFASVAECLDAGGRPCKRCRPLDSPGDADPLVNTLIDALESRPDHRWKERDVASLGIDPSTARRSFKRRFGITFLEMARLRRLRNGAETLAAGGRVLDAQLDAGFDSESGFRDALTRLLGGAPSKVSARDALKASWIDSPLGALIAVADQSRLHLLEFFDRKALPAELRKLRDAAPAGIALGRTDPIGSIELELGQYFAGASAMFSTPLACHGSAFTLEVWEALRAIPAATTETYGGLARKLGRPGSFRAVARANGANQISIVIPCHRVIGADGSLTGYGGGLWRKQWLLDHERRQFQAG